MGVGLAEVVVEVVELVGSGVGSGSAEQVFVEAVSKHSTALISILFIMMAALLGSLRQVQVTRTSSETSEIHGPVANLVQLVSPE